MKSFVSRIFLWIWLLLPLAAFGQMISSVPKAAAPSSWVETAVPESKSKAKPEKESGGQVYNLIDTQVNASNEETFVHVIKEITTEAGLQSGANLSFSWDPSYQELFIHEIAILRGAERIDRLDLRKVKVIQQETDLNRQIYNGTLSALSFVEDVRVGDRIEYSFSVRGKNPSLKSRYSEIFSLGGSVPVLHRRVRLLWPEGRKLNYKAHGIALEPTIRRAGDASEYIWELNDVPVVAFEDQLPSWFQAYPWIQLSEFTNWAEVAAWAAGFYVNKNFDAPELRDAIASLRSSGTRPEQILQNALDFTQNKIRYLGIEFGPNSYHPTDPVTVLRRRFGDCKDKSFLLCTLLKGLGYDAAPVLVATELRQTLPDFIPAPHDFNHAIVRVVVNGVIYWLDPTRSYQRGPVNQRYLPDYAFGLLVRQGEMDLTPIPCSTNGAPETVTIEKFHIGRQKGVTEVSVTSTYKGFDAEWMRSLLASNGRESMAKGYLNDYAQRYPGIKSSAPMDVEDFANSDCLTLSHFYTITNFWALSDNKQVYNCQFYPLGIHSWIMKPTTSVRSMPMGLSFPRRRAVLTRLELPQDFSLGNFTNTITGPGGKLHVEHSYRGQTLWLSYEYSALTNCVPISSVSKHLSSLDLMENALGYSLMWRNVDASNQFNWTIFLVALIYASMFIVATTLIYRRGCKSPPPLVDPLADKSLSGLGGWLILVGIGLFIGPIRTLGAMKSSLGAFELWKWQNLTTPGGVSYSALWGPILTMELLFQISFLALSFFVLMLFFKKRRMFPRWYIALLVFAAVFTLGDAIAVQFLNVSHAAKDQNLPLVFLKASIGCGIWIPYMLTSRRVKATFVR